MPETEPQRDWLVWFAHKVASEDDRHAHLPGSSWCLMLREAEAHSVVQQMNEVVQAMAGREVLAVRSVVERYGRVWAKDKDYYEAAEALGIEEPPPDPCAEAGRHVCGPCPCGAIGPCANPNCHIRTGQLPGGGHGYIEVEEGRPC